MSFIGLKPLINVPEVKDVHNRSIGNDLRRFLMDKLKANDSAIGDLALQHTISNPVYQPTTQIDLSQGGIHVVTATNGSAFALADPINPTQTATYTLVISNNSGGAMGAVTFPASIKQSGFVAPGAGLRTSATFYIQNGISYQRTPWSTPI